MKFAIKPEDKLALVVSLVPHTVQGAERQDIRLTAWDDLGVRKFARMVAQRQASSVNGSVGFKKEEIEPFAVEKLEVVDLQATTVQFLIDEIAVGVPGVYVDQLSELRQDLKRLQDKNYQLPQEVRDGPPG